MEKQAQGRYLVTQAWGNGDKRALPECQWARLDFFQTMTDDLQWDIDTQMLLCGLDTDEFDHFMDTYDPYPDQQGRIAGRTTNYLKTFVKATEKEANKKGQDTVLWWEDDTAPPMRLGKRGAKRGRDVSPHLRRGGSGASSSSAGRGGEGSTVRLASGPGRGPNEDTHGFLARRKSERERTHAGRWAQDWEEQMETYVAGKGQGKWHGQGQQTAGYSSDELDPYVSLETRAQIEREGVTDLSKRISTLTTPDWTKDIRDSLDEKNLRRLARMSPMARETVIKFYKRFG